MGVSERASESSIQNKIKQKQKQKQNQPWLSPVTNNVEQLQPVQPLPLPHTIPSHEDVDKVGSAAGSRQQ